ncbi:MAG: ATP-binding cassette domain-containing protein [Candidatus Dadabacteria bacterium]|nr:MAG: ATP-binding cassette domain-containing protein [Candidatus Dadabacteria bacterium]
MTAAIKIRDLHKSFGSQVVLDGISLEIPTGKITTIVGPSGVGKSVLLKLIAGILTPEIGDILIFGENMAKMQSEKEKNSIRQRLGILFQGAALFDSISVYDNIAFPLKARGMKDRFEIHDRVTSVADSLSLTRYLFNLPQELSLGIRKRVGLARALISEPDIVLFDEPNTGLDPVVGQEVYDLIKFSKDRWGFTGVVISHELPEVFQVSDTVVMLLSGKIRASGSPEEFMRSEDAAVIQFMEGRKDGPIQIQ